MSNTKSTRCVFTVKEGQPSRDGANDAPAWLMLELDDDIGTATNGYLSLRLKPGATVADAERLARVLKQEVAALAFTKL